MRRGFMAAALRGLASGMVESGEAPEVQAEAVLRLGELVSQADAELSSAAQAALRQFRLPPGLRR
jgi:hypothetical protein